MNIFKRHFLRTARRIGEWYFCVDLNLLNVLSTSEFSIQMCYRYQNLEIWEHFGSRSQWDLSKPIRGSEYRRDWEQFGRGSAPERGSAPTTHVIYLSHSEVQRFRTDHMALGADTLSTLISKSDLRLISDSSDVP